MNHTNLTTIRNTAALVATTLLVTACGGGGGGGGGSAAAVTSNASGTNFDIAANLVDNIVIPGYQAFSASTNDLTTAINTYCLDVTDTNNRDAAQAQWREVSNLWQATQSFAVGPVSVSINNLITRIYSPSAHTSGQDDFITAQVALVNNPNYSIPSDAENLARGLDALEFLLFPPNPVPSNQADRCTYAALVAAEITSNGQAAVNAWTANNNAGRNDFLRAQDSAGVTQIQAFFDLIVDNIDRSVKDTKLGNPTNLRVASPCTTNLCPELVENNIAKHSYASIKANLESAKAVFTGNNEEGFDDIFAEANRQGDSNTFITNLDATIASIDAQSATNLFDQLTAIDNPTGAADCATTGNASSTNTAPEPCAIFREAQVLSDFLRTTFATVVNLDVPGQVAGDGD